MEKKREIAKLAKIINDRVGTNLGQIHGTKSGFGKSADITATVDTKLVAKAIIEACYINGADFVEWLKHKTLDPTYRVKMQNFMFDSLLQEYLKGE